MTLNELSQLCYERAKDKGFHDRDRGIPEEIALMHSELSEALEEYRTGISPDDTYRVNGKPEGIPSEMADVLIRVFDFAGKYGIDLDAIVAEKLAFNATRPFMHGKIS